MADQGSRLGLATALVAVALVLIPLGRGEAAEPVRLGYVEFPPFTYTDSEGAAQGSLIEMVGKVAADAGVLLAFTGAPADRLFRAIADGSLNLFMGVTSPREFVGTTLVGDSVVARIELDAYAMDETPAVHRPEDLAGRSVIVIKGYSYNGWRPFLEDPANAIIRLEVDSAEQALSALRGRRGQVLLEYTLPMRLALAGRTLPNLKSTQISVVDAHFVLSKRTPDAAAVLARLEASFKRLREAGALP